MNLSEFGVVLKFIDKIYTENDLQAKYAELVTTIQQQSQTPSPETSAKYKQQRNDLATLLESLQPEDLGYSKQEIYDQLEAGNYIGKGAAQRLKDVLAESNADTNTAITKIQELSNMLHEYKERINQITSGMADLITTPEKEVPEGKAILQLVFTDDVSIDNIEDLEKAAGLWKIIIKGLAEVAGDPQDSPEIRTVSKNSPFLMEIAGYAGTLTIIATLVDKILDIYIKILKINEIRNQAKATEVMKSAEKAAEEDIKTYKVKELERIRKEALTEALKKTEKDLAGDTKNWYHDAVEKIYNFIVKGGRVEVATAGKDNVTAEGEVSAAVPGLSFKIVGKFAKVKELETIVGPDRKLIESTITAKDNIQELKVEVKPEIKKRKVVDTNTTQKAKLPKKPDETPKE